MSEIKLTADSGGGTTSIKAPSSTTSNADVVLKLPVADGSSGQVLKTDGSGQLSFTSNAGTTINNNATTKFITGTDNANELDCEANLSYNNSVVTFSSSNLSIDKSTNPTVAAKETAGNKEVQLRANTTGGLLRTIGSYPLVLGTNQTERMRIDSSGKVGIGTASPIATLDVYDGTFCLTKPSGNASSRNWRFLADNAAAGNLGLQVSTAAGGSTFSNVLEIDSSGNVGIGTTSPDSILHVDYDSGGSAPSSGTAPEGIAISYGTSDGKNGGIWFSPGFGDDQGISGIAGSRTSGYDTDLRFYTNNTGSARAFTERMRIASNGRVDIGNSLGSAAAGKFQVVEESGSDQTNDCNAYFETNASDWNIKTYYNKAGTHYHLVFVEQGTERGNVSGSDGSNVTFNQGSDYRWKENVVRMTGDEGIEICKKLKPSKYNWIENREQTGEINTVDGFIAHEVVEAGVLGAVTGEKDAVNEDGSIKGQMLDYGQVTPVLAAAIKGLIAKVETLETKVVALEGA